MMKIKNLLILCIISCINLTNHCLNKKINRSIKTTDLIIFSFNRPLQLYALLESIEKYVTNLNKVYLLYRTTNAQYDEAYNEIKNRFPNIHYLQQGGNPRGDFKPLLMQAFFNSSAEYVMCAVDDDMVKDYIDIHTCIDALEETNAHEFSLRLGLNITDVYPTHEKMRYPAFTELKNDVLMFQFNNGNWDWLYPHNLDMTIFRKSEVQSIFQHGSYTSPNTLEIAFAITANPNAYGLCFKSSKKFMVPLNIIQQDWFVFNEGSFSIAELFAMWKNGLKMDIDTYFQHNNSCIMAQLKPTFIPR